MATMIMHYQPMNNEPSIDAWTLPKGAEQIIREIAAKKILLDMINVINVKAKKDQGGHARYFSIQELAKNWRQQHPIRPVDHEAIRTLILEFPGLCRQPFEIDWDGGVRVLYPLTILACLDSPLSLIKLVYQCHPQAIHDMRGPKQCLPLHYACTFNASVEVLQFLIEQNPESIQIPRKDEMLPLHLAAYFKCDFEVIQFLYESWPQALEELDYEAWTPLHAGACSGASFEVMKYLLDHEPTNAIKLDVKQRSPLFLATCKKIGSNSSVQNLLRQAQTEQQHER